MGLKAGEDRPERDSQTFALVIQGPLLSTGKMGDHTGFTSFDCIENILRLQVDFGHLFDEIVVSTWLPNAPSDHRRIEALVSAGIALELNTDHGLDFRDNRLRQWFSTLAGLRRTRSDVVMKMRSDQFFDLSRFLNDFLEIRSGYRDFETLRLPSQLHGLFYFRDKPFAVADFALVANRSVLARFLEAQFDFRNLPFFPDADWPEGDAMQKFMWTFRKDFPHRKEEFFRPSTPSRLTFARKKDAGLRLLLDPETFRIWELALRSVVSVSSRAVTDTLVWRGKPYVPNKHLLFRDDWLVARLDFPGQLDIFGVPVFQTSPRLLQKLLRSRLRVPVLWVIRRSLEILGLVNVFLGFKRRPLRIGAFLFSEPRDPK